MAKLNTSKKSAPILNNNINGNNRKVGALAQQSNLYSKQPIYSGASSSIFRNAQLLSQGVSSAPYSTATTSPASFTVTSGNSNNNNINSAAANLLYSPSSNNTANSLFPTTNGNNTPMSQNQLLNLSAMSSFLGINSFVSNLFKVWPAAQSFNSFPLVGNKNGLLQNNNNDVNNSSIITNGIDQKSYSLSPNSSNSNSSSSTSASLMASLSNEAIAASALLYMLGGGPSSIPTTNTSCSINNNITNGTTSFVPTSSTTSLNYHNYSVESKQQQQQHFANGTTSLMDMMRGGGTVQTSLSNSSATLTNNNNKPASNTISYIVRPSENPVPLKKVTTPPSNNFDSILAACSSGKNINDDDETAGIIGQQQQRWTEEKTKKTVAQKKSPPTIKKPRTPAPSRKASSRRSRSNNKTNASSAAINSANNNDNATNISVSAPLSTNPVFDEFRSQSSTTTNSTASSSSCSFSSSISSSLGCASAITNPSESVSGNALSPTSLSELTTPAIASSSITMPTASSRPPPRNMNRWILLGQFNTEEEMHQARSKEKVSKRRTEQLKNGVKVRYRCNKWKRTKCGFQMYSFYHANNGPIELFETGEHDHSGRRLIEFEMNKRNKDSSSSFVALAEVQRPSQEDIVTELLSYENLTRDEVIVNVGGSSSGGGESSSLAGAAFLFCGDTSSILSNNNNQENPNDQLLSIATARANALEEAAATDFKSGTTGLVISPPPAKTVVNVETTSTAETSSSTNNGWGTDGDGNLLSMCGNKSAVAGAYGNIDRDQEGQPQQVKQKLKQQKQRLENKNNNSNEMVVDKEETMAEQKRRETEDLEESNMEIDVIGGCYVHNQPQENNNKNYIETIVFVNGNNDNNISLPLSPQGKLYYSLKDQSSIADLLEIASDLDIFFTRTSKCGSDFEFRSNVPLLKRSVSLNDEGDLILVNDRLYEKSIREERWQKGDWSQFLWALRGKCAKFLCEPARLDNSNLSRLSLAAKN